MVKVSDIRTFDLQPIMTDTMRLDERDKGKFDERQRVETAAYYAAETTRTRIAENLQFGLVAETDRRLEFIRHLATKARGAMPCRVDEMTDREFAIFRLLAEALGDLRTIEDLATGGWLTWDERR